MLLVAGTTPKEWLMDRRTKKRLAVLKKKRQNLRTQISTVRRFPDDPSELVALEAELAKVQEELERLESS